MLSPSVRDFFAPVSCVSLFPIINEGGENVKPTKPKSRAWCQVNEDSLQVLERIVMNEERDMILQRSTLHVVLLEGINFFPESE